MAGKKRSLTVVFLVTGVVCAIASVAALLLQEETRGWSEGVAVVKQTGVVHRSGTEGSKTAHLYEPEILYEYVVAGQAHQGRRIAIVSGGGHGSEAEAARVLEAYPVGAEVPVFYDPEKPARAVLEPGGSLANPLGFGIGAVILLFLAFLEGRGRRPAGTPAQPSSTAA